MTTTGVRPRPTPEVDPLTAPFWASVAEGVLSIQRCSTCERFIHAPLPVCPTCHSTAGLHWAPVSGSGTIFSLTIVHRSRLPWFDTQDPYVVAMVELDEQPGLFMFGNLPHDHRHEVSIGDRVRVFFEDVEDGQRLPQFEVAS